MKASHGLECNPLNWPMCKSEHHFTLHELSAHCHSSVSMKLVCMWNVWTTWLLICCSYYCPRNANAIWQRIYISAVTRYCHCIECHRRHPFIIVSHHMMHTFTPPIGSFVNLQCRFFPLPLYFTKRLLN